MENTELPISENIATSLTQKKYTKLLSLKLSILNKINDLYLQQMKGCK